MRGGEKNYINSRPQHINNGLELSSDNLYDHPHNLEENLLNNKSAGGSLMNTPSDHTRRLKF